MSNFNDLVWCPVCHGMGQVTVRVPRKVTSPCGNCLGTAWVRDSDGTRSAETACPAPVPKDCQARAESIAQRPSPSEWL